MADKRARAQHSSSIGATSMADDDGSSSTTTVFHPTTSAQNNTNTNLISATTITTIGNDCQTDDDDENLVDDAHVISVPGEGNAFVATAATTTSSRQDDCNRAYSAVLRGKILQQQYMQEKRDEMELLKELSSSSSSNILLDQSTKYNNRFNNLTRGVGSESSRYFSGTATVSPGAAIAAVSSSPFLLNSWSWSEQLFFSQDDESVELSVVQSMSDGTGDDVDLSKGEFIIDQQTTTTSFPSIEPVLPSQMIGDYVQMKKDGEHNDDETCNDTIQEASKRSSKAHRASTVGAFVIFLKALFGIGMLSNPKVMGEVGLLLGTFCHLLIVVGCAFACYLLLSARQIAKMEIQANQCREKEEREEYEMWRKDVIPHNMETSSIEMKRNRTPQTKNFQSANQSSAFDKSDQSYQAARTGGNDIGEDVWGVAPIPLSTVVAIAAPEKFIGNNPSCVNLQELPLAGNSERMESKLSSSESKKGSNIVSDEYQIFPDKRQNDDFIPFSKPHPPRKAQHVRLVTYGDVAKCLVGERASFFIIFAMVMGHLMFASGMLHLAIENLCYVAGWERLGWSYVEEYVEDSDNARSILRRLGPSQDQGGDHHDNLDDGDHYNQGFASRSTDEEEYYLEWKGPDFIGRLAMASLLFPIIHGLLQIPSLTELAAISSFGLMTYAVGCIGSMLYAAVVLTEGHPFVDRPDDMWTTKWSGVPTYVATTIYCIEGINLALPTVNSIEGTQRWGGGSIPAQNQTDGGGTKKEDERQHLAVLIVVGGVFMYGLVTLLVSWIGLAGGLGGGAGTMHGEDGCWDVTYCLNSSAVRYVYMLSLGVALVLTLPVILYPSTQMLEIWLDERNDERHRKTAGITISPKPRRIPPLHCRRKSLLLDDETVDIASESLSQRPIETYNNDTEVTNSITLPDTEKKYTAPTDSNVQETSRIGINFLHAGSPHTVVAGTKVKVKRKVKYWKLRMLLAFIICLIGMIEGSFPSVLKASEVIRGVCLSVTGLIVPPLLYMSAVGGDFSAPMAAAMALLIGLGLFNIVLVLMSVFGSRDFIVEEGRGNFYDM